MEYQNNKTSGRSDRRIYMKNKFDFYETVEIVDATDPKYQAILGRRGSVLGMVRCKETDRWFYSVMVDDTCWYLPESLLEGTGEFKLRTDFYDGDSISVSVDPETGEGMVTEGE